MRSGRREVLTVLTRIRERAMRSFQTIDRPRVAAVAFDGRFRGSAL